MFKKCCSSRSEKNYKIHHSPRPIELSDEMDSVIKKLLWYTPNIDSYQSSKNELIKFMMNFHFLISLVKWG